MSHDSTPPLYRRAQISGSALGDEIVFFDDRVGKYFATGAVGADIWRMLETPSTLDTIVSRLLETYDVDAQTCRMETQAFLDQMMAADLVQLA